MNLKEKLFVETQLAKEMSLANQTDEALRDNLTAMITALEVTGLTKEYTKWVHDGCPDSESKAVQLVRLGMELSTTYGTAEKIGLISDVHECGGMTDADYVALVKMLFGGKGNA